MRVKILGAIELASPERLVGNSLPIIRKRARHIIASDAQKQLAVAHAALDAPHEAAPYAFTLPHDTLPVRKTFADWLLFRGIKTVRRRLFGPLRRSGGCCRN